MCQKKQYFLFDGLAFSCYNLLRRSLTAYILSFLGWKVSIPYILTSFSNTSRGFYLCLLSLSILSFVRSLARCPTTVFLTVRV